jgi:hypothetical protein
MTQAQIIKRLDGIERELRELKSRLNGHSSPRQKIEKAAEKPSAEKLYGVFRNDPYFEKAMSAGAAYRRSLRPRSRSARVKKK